MRLVSLLDESKITASYGLLLFWASTGLRRFCASSARQ